MSLKEGVLKVHNDEVVGIVKLPANWRPTNGLYYPTEIFMADGSKRIVNSYKEHYYLIQKLCLNR